MPDTDAILRRLRLANMRLTAASMELQEATDKLENARDEYDRVYKELLAVTPKAPVYKALDDFDVGRENAN